MFEGLATVFPTVAIHRDIARRLMQIGPWLLDPELIVLQNPDKSVMSQILGLLAIAQLARPGADQLLIVVEKAFVSRHDAGLRQALGECRE